MKQTGAHTDLNTVNERILLLEKENQVLREQMRDYEYLKNELAQLKRMIFGSKSERYIPQDKSQLSLELDIEVPEIPETEQIIVKRKKNDKKKPVRTELPSHLYREEIIIEPEAIAEGSKRIGEVVTEILEYTPGKVYVKKYIRPKYANPGGEGITIANMPSLPIHRGNFGPGLISHLLTGKFVDHLPFHRQTKQFKREGIHLAESTINDSFASVCRLLQPLYDVQRNRIQSSNYLMADETPVPVLSKLKKNSTHRGYFWVYYSPPDSQVYFEYQTGRNQQYPKDFLVNFKGALQTDGYNAYDNFDKRNGITGLACMAHARRYFDKALKNDPKRAGYALEKIQLLYKIERKAKDEEMDFIGRKKLRQEKALPILKEIEQWLIDQKPAVMPESAIGKAIGYTLKLWPRLTGYINDGKYEIDNNWVENTIRPVALGRKNYMFAGSHEGAKRAAMMYSFFGSCQKNNINPYLWLKKVLEVIPEYKVNRLEELLPGNLILDQNK